MAVATADSAIKKCARPEWQHGQNETLALIFTPGKNPFGFLTRSEKCWDESNMGNGWQRVVCHYHSKLVKSRARWWCVGWHQEEWLFYGYWVHGAARNVPEWLRFAQARFRVNRSAGEQSVIARRSWWTTHLKLYRWCAGDQQPGDTLFFHSNLLHRSAANIRTFSLVNHFMLFGSINIIQWTFQRLKEPLLSCPWCWRSWTDWLKIFRGRLHEKKWRRHWKIQGGKREQLNHCRTFCDDWNLH